MDRSLFNNFGKQTLRKKCRLTDVPIMYNFVHFSKLSLKKRGYFGVVFSNLKGIIYVVIILTSVPNMGNDGLYIHTVVPEEKFVIRECTEGFVQFSVFSDEPPHA